MSGDPRTRQKYFIINDPQMACPWQQPPVIRDEDKQILSPSITRTRVQYQ